VHIAGVVRQPHDASIQQIARNLTDSVDGILRGKRYLIHDRDPLFTEAFQAILHAAGIECLKLPPQSPNLGAIAERFVLSVNPSVSISLFRSVTAISALRSPSSSTTTISNATTKASTTG
jgi:hypothetical protein